MVSIDPHDDSLHRYIVWHYHFVEEFGERKLEAECAFSTLAEAGREFTALSDDLLKRQAQGLADAKEYYSCGYRRPGYEKDSAHQRLEARKMRSSWTAQGLDNEQTGGGSSEDVS